MGEIYQSVVLIGRKNVRVKAFLDSGASTTYINIKLLKQLGYNTFKQKNVYLGNGQKIVGYQTSVIMKVRGKVKSLMAVAISMPEKLILGHDFFQDNDIILDYSEDKFRFSNRIPSVNRRLKM